jgi:hypothetical protein
MIAISQENPTLSQFSKTFNQGSIQQNVDEQLNN